ncbi:nucleoid-associated protein [Faecalibacter rhinopitheci]|uniref:Nucleoid-associated protein n=1 Tax=Faecalibacter rhinopitheci TaxID=2779678 RepID=A0A8J7G5W2_9FLAO|nr:nucleoid-associated protein [Faecalibacter rhinopitheci]MBF0597287.1 nucleoid-associated protein [Faecalibacter rhinopitheci]MBQ0147019.1 nucleoid-associated protein [Candidatus Onthonaster equi]
MIDVKNAYIGYITLQKVGHKVREEANIIANETMPVDEKKEEDLVPFLLAPFKKNLETHRFHHYTDKLEFNVLYNLAKSTFDEEIDFLDFSNEALQHLYEKSLHPQIKSGEVFMVMYENMQFEEIPCRGLAIYKLENKKKFLRFDESKGIDYNIWKGYKLEGIDKACLILDVYREEGFRVFSIDDQHQESEYWKKNFLEIDLIKNNSYHTKKYLELIEDFSNQILLDKTDRKSQAEFISNSIQVLQNNEIITNDIIEEEIIKPFELIDEYKGYKKTYAEDNKIDFVENFEVSIPTLSKESKKIKSEIKLDTKINIKIDLSDPDAAEEHLERGFDDEKKMFYYKVYFNKEQ